jgi:hypothetical protein
MATHSYSRCRLHLICATLNRERSLSKSAAVKLSGFLHEYSQSKEIYMKINYQEEHHRRKTFAEEYEKLVRVYGLICDDAPEGNR